MAVKKTTKKKRKAKKAEAPPDIRAPLEATPAHLKSTLAEVRASLEGVEPPEEARASDLVDAMLHITMAEGLPCAVGQECVRRFDGHFVDRNEFRLTEAFEVEELVADLEIPNCFNRALRARDSIAEIYNDQNEVTLEFLREASVTDRKLFFQRTPVIKPAVVHFVAALLTFEEILFSDRSTLRLQQRVGMDPKTKAVQEFFGELKQLVARFGHLPLAVAAGNSEGLSAASLVIRLAPPGKV